MLGGWQGSLLGVGEMTEVAGIESIDGKNRPHAMMATKLITTPTYMGAGLFKSGQYEGMRLQTLHAYLL